MLRSIAFAFLIVFVVTGCDSSEDVVLNTDYLEGTWTFDRIVDTDNVDGPRETDTINDLIDDFAVTFSDGGTAQLTIDFSDQVRNEDTVDFDGTNTYTLTGSSLQFGTSTNPPLVYTATAIDADTIELSGNGFAVTLLLGLDLEIDLNSPALVRLTRR